jgi:hypothetical protein
MREEQTLLKQQLPLMNETIGGIMFEVIEPINIHGYGGIARHLRVYRTSR